MQSMTRRLAGFAGAALLAATATAAAYAQSGGDPIRTADGIDYACAGVGKASRNDPRWAGFSVKLQFAAANGDFLGDPAVTLTDGGGKQVFQAQCDGPWVLIELAPGSYKVHATGQKGQYAKDFEIVVKSAGQTAKTIRLP